MSVTNGDFSCSPRLEPNLTEILELSDTDIRELLVEREPVLMIRTATCQRLDRISETCEMRALGIIPEALCAGHFPGNPVAPLACLALLLGQTCSLAAAFASRALSKETRQFCVFEADGVRLQKRVRIRPGHELALIAVVSRRRGPVWEGSGVLFHDGIATVTVARCGLVPMSGAAGR